MLGISDPTLIVLSAVMTVADYDMKETVADGNVLPVIPSSLTVVNY